MDYETLIQKALEAQKNSYSPYSNFKVGAALLTQNDNIYIGCNIENSAYGPSNCAERTAIFSAIANGERKFKAIAVLGGEGEEFVYPCGVCRQIMVEFSPCMEIIVAKSNGEYTKSTAKDLLPHYFSLNTDC